MRTFLAVLAAWLLSATLASAQMMGISGGPFTVGSAYSGPGDVVSGAAVWYSCTRSYNAAFATGSNAACNLRRASDNATQDFVILANGKFDVSSALTFAGADASCTGVTSGASTTIAFTSCSSTPHAGSTLIGVGLVLPAYLVSCGAFVAGAGSCTLNTAQTLSSNTFFMTYGLYVATAYDQSGAGNCTGPCNATQPTTAAQPQWLPNCVNLLPCMSFVAANSQVLSTATWTNSVANGSIAAVAERNAAFTTVGILWGRSGGNLTEFTTAANTIQLSGTGSISMSGVADSAWHAIQSSYGAAGTGILNADGTSTTGSSTASAASTSFIRLGEAFSAASPLQGHMPELGVWATPFTSGQITSICHSASSFYAISGATC